MPSGHLQDVCVRREIRWPPFQSLVRTINHRRILESHHRTTRTVPGASAAHPQRAPCLQATQWKKESGEESKLWEIDAMFSLGYSLSISIRHSSLTSHRLGCCNFFSIKGENDCPFYGFHKQNENKYSFKNAFSFRCAGNPLFQR